MIAASQLSSIGSFFKPHGIKGELSAELDEDLSPADLRCIVLDIDGIFTPFFIDSFRPKGASNWLIKLDGVDNEQQAAAFANKEIYGLTSELPFDTDDSQEGIHLFDLIGYTLINTAADGSTAPLGTIAHIDDSTANVLLHIDTPDGRSILVPFADDLISALDPQSQTITMTLPHGIIDLN